MFGTCYKGSPPQLSLRDPADRLEIHKLPCLGKMWGDYCPCVSCPSLCQAGRHLPHDGKQCPKTHWDAQCEAGSALKTKLKTRVFQQGAMGSSKTCHCRWGYGGFSPRPETRRERVQLCFGEGGSPGPFFVSLPS